MKMVSVPNCTHNATSSTAFDIRKSTTHSLLEQKLRLTVSLMLFPEFQSGSDLVGSRKVSDYL